MVPLAMTDQENSFERKSQERRPSFLVEFMDFLVNNKKWWLTPIILILLVLSLFIVLTNTAIGPLIYVLF
jgi:hypothetical protein